MHVYVCIRARIYEYEKSNDSNKELLNYSVSTKILAIKKLVEYVWEVRPQSIEPATNEADERLIPRK